MAALTTYGSFTYPRTSAPMLGDPDEQSWIVVGRFASTPGLPATAGQPAAMIVRWLSAVATVVSAALVDFVV